MPQHQDWALAPETVLSAPARALLALRNLEAVAGAAHRLQVPRILRIDLDFLTDAAHINVHRARRHKARIAPHRIQQMVAAEYSSRMPRQVIQQPELGR